LEKLDKKTRLDFGPKGNLIAAFLLVSPILIFFLSLPGLIQVDWRDTFYKVSLQPFSPYKVISYNYFPWPALVISPLGLLPYMVSRVINSYLNILFTFLIILKYKGGKLALFIVFTSMPVISLIATSSIEWVVMLGLLLANEYSPIFILAKPQSCVFILFIWFKKATNKLKFVLPTLLFILASFIIWKNWPLDLLANLKFVKEGMQSTSFSPWPWGIPLGLVLLFYAWKRSDEMLAILSTWFLAPFYNIHSMTIGMTVLAARKPKVAIAVSLAIYALKIYREVKIYGIF
jgi:hypothetical protein